MNSIRTIGVSAVAFAFAFAVVLSFGIVNADTALSVSCAGVPAISSITWTATPSGGVSPVALLWGNGATTSSQTLAYAPGLYSMTIQATDASSTVATSTCSAIVAQQAPSITAFTATPSSVAYGHSSLLSWTVTNASTTAIDQGVGTVTGTSVLVVPTLTTTYTLSAGNPTGTTTAAATVTVSTSTSSGGSTLQERIQALLQQITGLQQQLAILLAHRGNSTATTTPSHIPPGQVGKAACIVLTRSLHEGDEGDDVRSIQEMLAEDPEDGFNVAPTGFFGPITARAMRHFQERNNIASGTAIDGSVGPLTRGFFMRHCGKGLTKEVSDDQATTSEQQSSSTGRGRSGENHGKSQRDND